MRARVVSQLFYKTTSYFGEAGLAVYCDIIWFGKAYTLTPYTLSKLFADLLLLWILDNSVDLHRFRIMFGPLRKQRLTRANSKPLKLLSEVIKIRLEFLRTDLSAC